jgi:hypothetical protein
MAAVLGTLVGVLATLGAVLLTARYARRSEQSQWQRDLRLQTYGDCVTHANEVVTGAVYLELNLDTGLRPDDSKTTTSRENMLKGFNSFESAVAQTATFGAATVAKAAGSLEKLVREAALQAVDYKDTQRIATSRRAAEAELDKFRTAVRLSLRITDE